MLVAVGSVKGSPGVTTLSMALAARWPQPARCVVVECDPSGGDVAARFSLASSPGLLSLAAAARRHPDLALVWQHTQSLPGALFVVAGPPGAEQARAALDALVSGDGGVLRAAASVAGVVVIADCGRVDPSSAVVPIMRSADVLLLLTGAHVDDLAHVAARLAAVGRWSRRPALVLAGPGYSASEVERELGVPALARIPHDPGGAAVLSGRPGGRRGPSRSPLGRAAARVAATLANPHPGTGPHAAARPGPDRAGDVVAHRPQIPLLNPDISQNGVRS